MRDELAELEWHWGEAYRIAHDDDGEWRAMRRQLGATILTAETATELRDLIHADYFASKGNQ